MLQTESQLHCNKLLLRNQDPFSSSQHNFAKNRQPEKMSSNQFTRFTCFRSNFPALKALNLKTIKAVLTKIDAGHSPFKILHSSLILSNGNSVSIFFVTGTYSRYTCTLQCKDFNAHSVDWSNEIRKGVQSNMDKLINTCLRLLNRNYLVDIGTQLT